MPPENRQRDILRRSWPSWTMNNWNRSRHLITFLSVSELFKYAWGQKHSLNPFNFLYSSTVARRVFSYTGPEANCDVSKGQKELTEECKKVLDTVLVSWIYPPGTDVQKLWKFWHYIANTIFKDWKREERTRKILRKFFTVLARESEVTVFKKKLGRAMKFEYLQSEQNPLQYNVLAIKLVHYAIHTPSIPTHVPTRQLDGIGLEILITLQILNADAEPQKILDAYIECRWTVRVRLSPSTCIESLCSYFHSQSSASSPKPPISPLVPKEDASSQLKTKIGPKNAWRCWTVGRNSPRWS